MSHISRPCPICANDDTKHCLDNPMAAVGGFDMSYTVVRCNCCGFHFAKRIADSDTFSAYYQSVSKYDAPVALPPVDLARIQATVRFLEGRVAKTAHIVDLGCGYGALLGGLQTAGWSKLQGLDPAPNAAQCALEIFGVRDIRRGTMFNAHEVLELLKIDLVCIMCVLEHLPNLKQDLTQLLSKLRPGCKVLVEVPAIECFSNPNGEPFGEFSLEHIQFFDMTSLSNLMRSLGAEPIAIELLDLPMVASGDMLSLFEWSGTAPLQYTYSEPETDSLAAYIAQSQEKMEIALQQVPSGPLIIYGAGSHTARLLQHLERKAGCDVISIVDSNPNLAEKKIGRWTVKVPSTIHENPDIAVLISSFRSQNSIANQLRQTSSNPLILMYTNAC